MEILEVLGYLGLFAGIGSYLFKGEIKFRQFQLLSNLFFVIHFYGSDSLIGSISCLIGVISLSVNLYDDKSKLNNIFPLLYISLFLYSIFNFEAEKWYELLPAISNLIWCYAMLYCKGQKVNYLMLPVVGFWIVYTIQIDSLSGLLTQFVVLLFLLSRIIRLGIDNKKSEL
jgi:hypothetical protein